MNKAEHFIMKVNEFVQKANDDDFKETLDGYGDDEIADIITKVELYEKQIAKLLREQKKHFITGLQKHIQKDIGNVLLGSALTNILSDLQQEDKFEEGMTDKTRAFLHLTIDEFSSRIMDSIDPDVPFEVLSNRTLNWVDDWSPKLANIMKLNTHTAVQSEIEKTLTEGGDIRDLTKRLEKLPQFDRKRARATAITETLTANSASQQESYHQSPAVEGKTWQHSGSKGIDPRPAHIALSGTTVETDAYFDVNGYSGLYPRGVDLPASERVYCHCYMNPKVNAEILGLPAQEKKFIRDRNMSGE